MLYRNTNAKMVFAKADNASADSATLFLRFARPIAYPRGLWSAATKRLFEWRDGPQNLAAASHLTASAPRARGEGSKINNRLH